MDVEVYINIDSLAEYTEGKYKSTSTLILWQSIQKGRRSLHQH